MGTRFFDPRAALDAALSAMNPTLAPGLAEHLLDAEHVYTSRELPLGFRLRISFDVLPEPVVLFDLTLVKGAKYNVTVQTWKGKTQHLRGWTFDGERWGDLNFHLEKKPGWSGPGRNVNRGRILGIEPVDA